MNRTLARTTLVALLALSLAGLGACAQAPDAAEPDAPAADGAAPEAPVEEAAAGGDAARGEELFVACAACHGADARGIEGLGKDLHANAFIADMTDEEVVAFLKVGREATHELNSTGVAMPPKGGNPALSDEDLLDIVAYMRALD